MKIPFALSSLVLAGSVGSFALAQSPAAPPAAVAPAATPALVAAPAPSPERVEAAKTLMQNMRFAETLQKVLDARKESMVRMIDQSVTMLPPGSATPAELAAYKQDMIDTYTADMSAQAALDGMVKVYAELFSVAELKGMAGFYASPAGQAMVDKTMELQQKSGAVLQNQIQVVMPKLQAKQKAFVAAHPAKTLPKSAPAPTAAAPAPTPPAPAPSK